MSRHEQNREHFAEQEHPTPEHRVFCRLSRFLGASVSSFGLAVDGLGWDGPGWDGPGGDVSGWDVPGSDDPGWDDPGLVELPGEVGVAGSVTGGMASFSSWF